jgi:hypothetical protein
MKANIKNTNSFDKPLRSSRASEDEIKVDKLFESDWDELVIRFDEATGQFVAKTASQPLLHETADAAA